MFTTESRVFVFIDSAKVNETECSRYTLYYFSVDSYVLTLALRYINNFTF